MSAWGPSLTWWIPALALLVDRVLGDPLGAFHPVVLFGRYISWFERTFLPRCQRSAAKFWLGSVLTVTTVVLAYGVPFVILRLCSHWFWLATFLRIVFIWTTIAWRGLRGAALDVLDPLRRGDLSEARSRVARVVGRDTQQLDVSGVTRAAVETVAENSVDGILAPLFFAALGGASLAMLYRAVNTLDSMVGYRSTKYLYFGRVSARLDDVLNYIPARISVLLLTPALLWLQLPMGRAWKVVLRDAHKHPSPNGGWPESAFAGALGVQLGGLNVYQGVASSRALLGDAHCELQQKHILQSVKLLDGMVWIAFVLLVMGGGVSWVLFAGK
ncbi:MAG: adenosylcobinamide-phosphate synthase CbiB [Alicyclobacillaceae bacterium]|uniref:adenosylcobinamide-phosphate synthase CbiB n=1 Tax=Alicyclobacillus sp. SP_1 TaxID=2942475 RepID=UPI0021582E2A|nr:adenosylcobinamide-phosphate synthase CbiB [Alicyclobacillus sp. SP_1]MCY0888507.1 adenosylcobinamide-phosphate synthase CbiB [Alicyclobacillaceae bacterium]